MKWQGREESSNIEDRRSQGGGGLGGLGGGFGQGGGFRLPTGGGRRTGGVGIVGLVIMLGLVWFLTGQNPIQVLTGGGADTTTSSSSFNPGSISQSDNDEMRHFVGVVIKETEDLWTQKFQAAGRTYTKPVVVLFSGGTSTGCGQADASSGPFYCPIDKKVYIDLAFYDQLRQQFGAPGDFAQGYVLAHEVGHHVQDLLGVLPDERNQPASQDEANAYSVRVELQADCYGGIWANYTQQQGLVESGDYQEAMTAANAIGDDTLTHGQVSSRNFTHGTSEQRMKWFKTGYKSGDPASCDTFSGAI